MRLATLTHDAQGLALISTAAAGGATLTVEDTIKAARAHLSMEIGFISEFVGERRYFRHVDSSDGNSPIRAGDSLPSTEGYCQRVVEGNLPECIPDTSQVPAAVALEVTHTLPIGAHMSVPIRLRDGQIYGTFCCFSRRADHSLNPRDLEVMRVLADLAARQIDRALDGMRDRDRTVQEIRKAITGTGRSMVFQPIVHLSEGHIVGFECLSRFAGNPARAPNEWFADAERVGLGFELESAALEMALSSLSQFPERMYLAVNASPKTVVDERFRALFEGRPMNRIVLEVTEDVETPIFEEFNQKLRSLRANSVRVAVDDVGIGYSNLQRILDLTPDMIKLDRSLTRHVDRDPARRALGSALVTFARDTGCDLIAEGVESQSELDTLRSLGVRKGQGFFFSRPLPLRSATDFALIPSLCNQN